MRDLKITKWKEENEGKRRKMEDGSSSAVAHNPW